ncbi:hypothetical protein UPYG_G00080420 [Umbra pygmaea]|uniref:Uncharacterized protein n=1 Tax=Umbra pygmaea TaxID=75934 RepID=A0ABD0XDQ6_UMBPY
MEGKYQRLVNKLKDWQGDSRDLVGGNASLFDDIEELDIICKRQCQLCVFHNKRFFLKLNHDDRTAAEDLHCCTAHHKILRDFSTGN